MVVVYKAAIWSADVFATQELAPVVRGNVDLAVDELRGGHPATYTELGAAGGSARMGPSFRGCSVVGVAWSAGKLTHAPGFRTSASRRRRCFLATSSQSVTEVAVALGRRSHQPVLSAPASRSLGYADHSLVRPYSRTRTRLVSRRTSMSSCSEVIVRSLCRRRARLRRGGCATRLPRDVGR